MFLLLAKINVYQDGQVKSFNTLEFGYFIFLSLCMRNLFLTPFLCNIQIDLNICTRGYTLALDVGICVESYC